MPPRTALFLLVITAAALFLQACSSARPADVTTDPVIALHDIWALETLNARPYEARDGLQRPTLELNLTDMRASGTDGCNNFTGAIREASPQALAFGPLAGTRKMCATGMDAAEAFNEALASTAAYRREELKLTLLDKSGQALMTLRKVD